MKPEHLRIKAKLCLEFHYDIDHLQDELLDLQSKAQRIKEQLETKLRRHRATESWLHAQFVKLYDLVSNAECCAFDLACDLDDEADRCSAEARK